MSNLQLLSRKITSKCCTAFCNSLRLLRPDLMERSCGRMDKALDLLPVVVSSNLGGGEDWLMKEGGCERWALVILKQIES